ncbi:MAG: CPBP family intramembrane glutamic endopeptidase [Phycisphaerae bacterium]|jgi:membrane protease YdiL (CAAX protease family)
MRFGKREKSRELDSYLRRTSRPIYSLIIVSILIVIYEAGLSFLSPDFFLTSSDKIPGMVVTFAWVRELLLQMKFSNTMSWVGTPLVVVVALIIVQVKSRDRIRISWLDVPITFAESALLALPLLVFSTCIHYLSTQNASIAPVPAVPDLAARLFVQSEAGSFMVSLVSGIGAGIFEELVFRLFLISLFTFVFEKLFAMPQIRSIMAAVIISSLLFSLHHYYFFMSGKFYEGEPFLVSTFIFRFVAGIYLAIVFGMRGFGIVAATHVINNIVSVFIVY